MENSTIRLEKIVEAIEDDDVEWFERHKERLSTWRHVHDGRLILYVAIEHQASNEILQKLVDSGVNPNELWKHESIWFRPIFRGQKRIFNFLLNVPGADLNVRDPVLRRTPLHLSVIYNGNDEFTETLLKTPGVDVDAQTLLGDTALHLAVERGKYSTVDLLLKHGANPYLSGRPFTPLSFAIISLEYRCVESFVSHGVWNDDQIESALRVCLDPEIVRLMERVRLAMTLVSPRVIKRIGVRSAVRVLPPELIDMIRNTI